MNLKPDATYTDWARTCDRLTCPEIRNGGMLSQLAEHLCGPGKTADSHAAWWQAVVAMADDDDLLAWALDPVLGEVADETE